jgi:hypothetical protein
MMANFLASIRTGDSIILSPTAVGMNPADVIYRKDASEDHLWRKATMTAISPTDEVQRSRAGENLRALRLRDLCKRDARNTILKRPNRSA